jgi:hypothetical protein
MKRTTENTNPKINSEQTSANNQDWSDINP